MSKTNTALKEEEKTVDWAARTVDIARQGTKIILPADPGEMSLEDGVSTLKRAIKDEQQVYAIHETIPVHFFDGCVALFAVMKDKYGYVGSQTKKGFWFDTPPRLIHVKVGPKADDFVQVPYGQFKLPNTEAIIETGYETVDGIPMLALNAEVRSKERKVVMELVLAVREYAKANSIYKGQCIRLRRDDSGGVDFDQPLEFFDPFSGKEVPIFNRVTENLIETALLTPIKNASICREHSIPLKRGVLLEGPYGTGKSLTARQAARIASNNGWTFINVDNVKAIKYALKFAKMYQPCVLFAEDIDRLANNRNEGANDLINEVDGVVGKNDEIITVLTTNFVDKIDKAMLRPGRLDAVVSLRPPEKEAVERLIRFYAADLLAADADLNATSDALAGQIPATIREVVERAKLGMIQRGDDKIVTADLDAAAESMMNHMQILDGAKEGQGETTLEDLIAKTINDTVAGLVKKSFVPQVLTAK